MESISSRLPEVDSEPLSDLVLDFLIAHDQEEPYLDFKETLDIGRKAAFPELAKDLLAFSNYGWGILLIGFRDKTRSTQEDDKNQRRQYIPIGLPEGFHVDQADLQTKYNSFRVHHDVIEYREFLRTIDSGVVTYQRWIHSPREFFPVSQCIRFVVAHGAIGDWSEEIGVYCSDLISEIQGLGTRR